MKKSQLAAIADRFPPAEHLAHIKCTYDEQFFLSNTFFPTAPTVSTQEATSVTKELPGGRHLALVGCDCKPGIPREYEAGVVMQFFEAPTIIETYNVNACNEEFLKLDLMESKASVRTWADRYKAAIIRADLMARAAVRRRKEWMAAQILVHGELLLQGPLFGKKLLKFGRDECLTMKWEKDAPWDFSDKKKLTKEKFQLFLIGMEHIHNNCDSGARITKVVMGDMIHQKLANMAGWKDECKCIGARDYLPKSSRFKNLKPMPGVRKLGDYLALDIEFCTYNEWYDECKEQNAATGEKCHEPTRYLPPNGMLIICEGTDNGLMGITKHNFIQHGNAVGIGPRGAGDVHEFYNSWSENSTGCMTTEIRSKFLPIAQNINAASYVEICPLNDVVMEGLVATAARKQKEQREKAERLKEAEQRIMASHSDDYRAKIDAEVKAEAKVQLDSKDDEIKALKAEVEKSKKAEKAAQKVAGDAKKAADEAAKKAASGNPDPEGNKGPRT